MEPNPNQQQPKEIQDLDKGVKKETLINVDNKDENAIVNELGINNKEEQIMGNQLTQEQIDAIAASLAKQIGNNPAIVQQVLQNAAQLKAQNPDKDERWFLQRWAEDYGVYLGTAAAAVLIGYFIKTRFFDSSDAVELGAAALNLLE